MHMNLKPLAWPLVTIWNDTHLCCEWGSCVTHTTSKCPSSSLWCYSLLVASMCFPGSPCLGFTLCVAIWGAVSLLLICISKVSLLLFEFWSILTVYQYAMSSKEMSRKSILTCMYLCRQAQYLSTRCRLGSLVPSLSSWSLRFYSVVHFMYLSS